MKFNDIYIFLSGVFYAAFLYFAPNLPSVVLGFSFFLPIIFYVLAISHGLRGLCLAFLPVALLEIVSGSFSSFIYFFLINLSVPFSIAYFKQARQQELKFFGFVKKYIFHNILFYTVSFQSLLVLSLFLQPEYPQHLLDIFKKLQPVLNIDFASVSSVFLFQLIFSVTLFFYAINYFYFLMAKSFIIGQAISIKKNIFNTDNSFNFFMDIPFLCCLWLVLMFSVFEVASYYRIFMLIFLALFSMPLVYVGLFSLKKKMEPLKVSENFFILILFVLFLLVQPMLIIVLLGLMECVVRSNSNFKTG